jgi:alkaline phosphatase D
VLAAGLEPARVHWYRFTDEQENGSRVGRTITAPADDDARPVRFAFVSCQNINQGACNAYRRMIYEDERAPENERLGFVLHLGDFIYEMVWYPEDRPQGYFDRRIYDVARYPDGEKIADFHVPTTVGDYRAAYRGHLGRPGLAGRAGALAVHLHVGQPRILVAGLSGRAGVRPERPPGADAQGGRQPGLVGIPAGPREEAGGSSLETFDPPQVTDTPLTEFDAHGLGQERNNLAAIASLQAYRATKWGANVDLFITDHSSYRSPSATDGPETGSVLRRTVPLFLPEEVFEIFDAGRDLRRRRSAATIPFAGKDIPNPRRDEPARRCSAWNRRRGSSPG